MFLTLIDLIYYIAGDVFISEDYLILFMCVRSVTICVTTYGSICFDQ